MAEIQTWFPETIYNEKLLNSIENSKVDNLISSLDKKYFKCTDDWLCPTITTFNLYSIHTSSNKIFIDLVDKIEEHVNAFARILGSEHKFKCKESWINISQKGNYQECHVHPNNSFSAVYYIKVPNNSGNIVFRKMPFETYELKGTRDRSNEYTYQSATYEVEEGQLLIFRSHIPHMVTENKSDENRISIALNFD